MLFHRFRIFLHSSVNSGCVGLWQREIYLALFVQMLVLMHGRYGKFISSADDANLAEEFTIFYHLPSLFIINPASNGTADVALTRTTGTSEFINNSKVAN